MGLCCTRLFVSVALLAHLDQCSAQSKTLKRASRSFAKTGFQGVFYGGLKMRSKIVSKKLFQRVPKWNPKVDQNRHERVLEGSPKGTSKRSPVQDQEK